MFKVLVNPPRPHSRGRIFFPSGVRPQTRRNGPQQLLNAFVAASFHPASFGLSFDERRFFLQANNLIRPALPAIVRGFAQSPMLPPPKIRLLLTKRKKRDTLILRELDYIAYLALSP